MLVVTRSLRVARHSLEAGDPLPPWVARDPGMIRVMRALWGADCVQPVGETTPPPPPTAESPVTETLVTQSAFEASQRDWEQWWDQHKRDDQEEVPDGAAHGEEDAGP